jgi:hypothetical protein
MGSKEWIAVKVDKQVIVDFKLYSTVRAFYIYPGYFLNSYAFSGFVFRHLLFLLSFPAGTIEPIIHSRQVRSGEPICIVDVAQYKPLFKDVNSEISVKGFFLPLVPSCVVLAGVAILLFRVPLAVVSGSSLEFIFAVKADVPGYW